MARAGFDGSFPVLRREGLGNWLDQSSYKELVRSLESLPDPIRKLFGFNLREITYSYSWLFSGPPMSAFVDDNLMQDRSSMIILHDGAKKFGFVKLLVHELSHTLDTRSYPEMIGVNPKDHFPDWLIRPADDRRWKSILKTESLPTELTRLNRSWAYRPSEQWACRMAATIAADYLVPGGLVPENDIVMDRKLSARRFKFRWPKSYRFFRSYLKLILAHAPRTYLNNNSHRSS